MENEYQKMREKIVKGLEETRRKLLIEKIKNDRAIAISVDGKVQVIYPGRTLNSWSWVFPNLLNPKARMQRKV